MCCWSCQMMMMIMIIIIFDVIDVFTTYCRMLINDLDCGLVNLAFFIFVNFYYLLRYIHFCVCKSNFF